MSQNLWIVGAGPMGRAYGLALNHLGSSFTVVGRGADSAKSLEKELGVPVATGGVHRALRKYHTPEMAILAVQLSNSVNAALELMHAGVPKILLEKPAALTVQDIDSLENTANRLGAEVWVAYNRRFYSSVAHARSLIKADGGLLSVHFDFTEFAFVPGDLDKENMARRRWLISNSSHVIDLVFFLSGKPSDLSCFHQGSLDWHPSSSRFAGSGITEKGVLFSYLSDWNSPGRWGIEFRTSERKLLLQPLEQLKEMKRDSFQFVPIDIDATLDIRAKPGLISMTKAFIDGRTDDLCTLSDQAITMPLYHQMAGYK